MTQITIEINGREVSEAEANQMIVDKVLDEALAARMEQVKCAIGDLPVELVFEGDLHGLELVVRKNVRTS